MSTVLATTSSPSTHVPAAKRTANLSAAVIASLKAAICDHLAEAKALRAQANATTGMARHALHQTLREKGQRARALYIAYAFARGREAISIEGHRPADAESGYRRNWTSSLLERATNIINAHIARVYKNADPALQRAAYTALCGLPKWGVSLGRVGLPRV